MTAGLKIEVQDLRLAYGPKEVIHGISFEVHEHEIFGIIGPAQSGKTSLLRCLNRTETLFLSPKHPKTAEYIEGRFG